MTLATTSIWEDSLTVGNRCDVAILGGGFLGMWSAYHLKTLHPSLTVHVYERDAFGLGASTRNAGFSCFGTVGEFASDVHTSSLDEALGSIVDRYQGLQEIFKLKNQYSLNFDLENIGGIELLQAHEAENAARMLPVLNKALAEQLGLSEVYHMAPMTQSSYGFSTERLTHSITNSLEAGVNSAKLLRALTEVNQSLGVKVFHGLEAVDIQGDTVVLQNPYRQIEVKAGRIVLALNSFANRFLPSEDAVIAPGRGQILWCDNLSLPFKGTFHFDEGYYYFRTIGRDQLLIGGARNLDIATENTRGFEPNVQIQEHLLQFVHNTLNVPDFVAKKQWQGIMGFTANKQPVMKEVRPNLWHLHACNGMGVALTPLIGKRFAQQFK